MFTNLRMVNFKSWADTGDVRLAPLTVLFGANSTGKSGLLQMLLLLKQTTESRDRNQVLQTGTDDPRSYVELGTPSEITHFSSNEMSLSVAWDWPKREQSFDYPVPRKPVEYQSLSSLEFSTSIQADETDEKEPFVTALSYKQGRGETNLFEVELNRESGEEYDFVVRLGGRLARKRPGRPNKYMSLGKCYSIPFEAWDNYRRPSYLLDLEWEFILQFRKLFHIGPFREYPRRLYNWAGDRPVDVGPRGERAVQALLAAKLQKRILQQLKELDLAESFSVRRLVKGRTQFEVRVRRHRGSHEVLLPDVGFGVSQVLPVLVLCLYAPQHSTIILEHPDMHLHTSAQAALADVLVAVAQSRDLQLIIETHSEHFLRRLQLNTAQSNIRPDDVALYFCNIEKGVSNIRELELDIFGQINNWPDGFFGDMTGDMIATLESSLDRQLADG